jgi:hypothetical protein
MNERVALVTLIVGDEFAQRWRRLCEANWREYADRHGFDLIAIDTPPDDSPRARDRSPSWQKLLLLGQPFAREYDRIVWVDADVVFGRDAPSIVDGVPAEKLGAVDELDLPPRARQMVHPEPMETYYGEFGLPGHFEEIVQAGIMVCSPNHHRELFERVYDSYEDKPGMFYEMRPLSYELLDAGMVHWIDPRFNTLWATYKAECHPWLLPFTRHPRAPEITCEALGEVHCLHFAAEADQMEFCLRGNLPGSDRPAPPAPAVEPEVRAPVALFLSESPDTSARAIDALRVVRPSRLLVVANAPRADVPGEEELSRKTRGLLETIDWECQVSTEFASEHLSQTERVESGIDWVFEEVGEAILLESDSVPDPSFFRFCDELLERHRDDDRVLSVGGTNFMFEGPPSADSYHFSKYSPTGGWATWRRAWRLYDPAMAEWPELRDSDWLRGRFGDPNAVAYWRYTFERAHRDRDAWDRIWLFACLLHGGLHAVPNVNLVTNTRPVDDTTHTRPENTWALSNLPLQRIEFPLSHPPEVAANEWADRFTDKLLFGGMVSEMFRRVRHTRRRTGATVMQRPPSAGSPAP